MAITIVTNNKPRKLLYGYQLPESIKNDFEYLGDNFDYSNFFKYKDNYYYVGEFFRTNENSELFNNWKFFKPDSFFSGIVFKYTNNNDYVIVGFYYC